MYRVYAGDNLILDTKAVNRFPITEAKLEFELNKTGSFAFVIHSSHPFYNSLNKLKTIIKVYQNEDVIFRGRILNDESEFHNIKQVTCEGELAFLLDSIIRPFGSDDEQWSGTPKEFLEKIIAEHNEQVEEEKQFKVGNVTVTDGDVSNTDNIIYRSESDYKNSWDIINEKLLDLLGGYLWVRHEGNNSYIDYLEDFDTINYTQSIELGKNLLDLKRIIKGEDVVTCLIPIGGEAETVDGTAGDKLTIKGLPNGEIARCEFDGEQAIIYKEDDYIYCDKAVERYGKIVKVVTWSDVKEDVDHLCDVAIAHLVENMRLTHSIELTSADISGIENVNPFRLSRRVEVKSKYHGLVDESFLIEKLTINLFNPSDNKLTVGRTYKTFTESTANLSAINAQIVQRIDKVEKRVKESGVTKDELDKAIVKVTKENTSLVEQSSTEILSQVSENYYLKDDANKLIESVNTEFSQTNEAFEMRFNTVNQDINDLTSGTDARFQEINKYIRFEDGNIILGEAENEVTLRIENDRISFLQSGVEVAYFSNRKLYVIDGEFLGKLKLGNYAYKVLNDGSLTFGLDE